MNKKAISRETIYIVLTVIVIFVFAVIIRQSLLKPDSPARSFVTTIAKSVGIQTETEDTYTLFAEAVGNILDLSESQNPELYSQQLSAQIGQLIKELDDSENYLINRYSRLRVEALANGKFRSAQLELENLPYSGESPEAFIEKLNAIANKFNDVIKSNPGTGAYELSVKEVARINKLKTCDFDVDECLPQKTNSFCVFWNDPSIVTTTGKDKCSIAKCDLANGKDLSYCQALQANGVCALVSNQYGTLDFTCTSCDRITKCEDYKFGESACNSKETCGKGLDCELLKTLTGDAVSCRPKGTGLQCEDIAPSDCSSKPGCQLNPAGSCVKLELP